MSNPKRCPECGTPVKATNLAGHYERVHPRVRLELTKEERQEIDHVAVMRRERPSSRLGWKTAAVVLVLLAVAGIGVAAFELGSSGAAGRIAVEPASWDFGDITQVTVSHSFLLKNVGTTPLRLDGISTSCMCTSAELTYMDQTSPRFGNHENPPWQLVIAPGTSGFLNVYYDPTTHAERGHFERQVYILSSDPAQRETSITIHAFEV